MSLVKSCMTPAKLAANRQNAQKSTGPRTARGKLEARMNGWKGGRPSSPQGIMRLLGESPLEFESMFEQLTASYRPANFGERLQLDQIAWLHWQLRRNLQGRLWKMVRRQEQLLEERERQWMESNSRYCQASFDELMSEGLIRRPEGPAKFTMLLQYLDILTRAAEASDFEIEFEKVLRLIYGEHPTLRGNTLLNCFRQCADNHRRGAKNENQYQLLLRTLYEEERDTLAGQQHYMRTVVEISPARRQAALTPSKDDGRLLAEQNLLIYQLESAYRVFFGMRRERRANDEFTKGLGKTKAAVEQLRPEASPGPQVGGNAGEPQPREIEAGGEKESTKTTPAGEPGETRPGGGHPLPGD